MLLLIAVLAFLSAAFLLFRFTRQHDPDLFIQHPVSFEPPPNARPLFAPSEAELRRETDHIAARRIAQREYRANAKARATVDAAIFNWRKERDSKNTLELLRVTAESGLDGDFSRAAREILEFFHKSGINGLKNDELAVLLDSHLRLLSEVERSSGEIFWLKQEVAKLRTEKVFNQ